MRNIAKVLAVTCLVGAGLVLNGCSSGASEAKDQMVAATMLSFASDAPELHPLRTSPAPTKQVTAKTFAMLRTLTLLL